MSEAIPKRGDLWFADIGEPIGHEAGFERPVLVVSTGRFNTYGLATIAPITRTERRYPTRVAIGPGNSGLDSPSFIQVEQIRTISIQRFVKQLGHAEPAQMQSVDRILRLLFALH